MTKIHIMLDLETWGTRPSFDLRSIGACVFDPLTGRVGNYRVDGKDAVNHPDNSGVFYIATDNPTQDGAGCFYHGDRKYPLKRDPETVAWWNDQSAEAQSAFANPVDLRDALQRFSDWFHEVVFNCPIPPSIRREQVSLWSHGPAFDVAILAAAYETCGLQVPWHYRAPRDTRTAFDMAGIDDHSAFMAQFPVGTAHHALDDAISQARCVCAAYAKRGEIADRLIDQSDEPDFSNGNYANRMNYWRDKAIYAANALNGGEHRIADPKTYNTTEPRRYPYADDQCPGHASDKKICAKCGTHVDEMRPDVEQEP